MLNVLALQMAHNHATLDECLAAYRRAADLVAVTSSPTVDQVLRLAAASGRTAYDCEFVAAAVDLDVRLVTTDKQILASFPDIAVSPESFVA